MSSVYVARVRFALDWRFSTVQETVDGEREICLPRARRLTFPQQGETGYRPTGDRVSLRFCSLREKCLYARVRSIPSRHFPQREELGYTLPGQCLFRSD